MATLAELLRQGADKLVNLPSEAQRFITNPQAFTQLLTGKNPLPRETGFAAGATGLPAQEMSVLDPNQAPYMQGYSQGEPIGYAGMAAPFAAPAAVATAKALAPKAGMMAENYMVKQGMIQPLTAYHGTPHTIQGQFDINKVGTGEGAQAYGHGMYFAENPAVAAEYRKNLSPIYIKKIDGQLYDSSNPEHLASHYVDMFAKRGKSADEIVKILVEEGGTEAHKIAANIIKKGNVKPISTEQGGNLYKVDIPDTDIPMMLDWDKSLTKQTPEVQAILKDKFPSAFDDPRQSTGQGLYKELVKGMAKSGAKDPEKFMSEILNEYGIKGIRYLDEGSRKTGGTSNFVVFEPNTVKILEENSKPVSQLQNIIKPLEKKGINLDIYESKNNPNLLTLSKIEVPKEMRQKGMGTDAMQELARFADKEGKTIALSPATDFGATSVNRLKDFYKRFGFVENKGRNKDFSISESMYRPPAKPSRKALIEEQVKALKE
jgi:hypothetical protein